MRACVLRKDAMGRWDGGAMSADLALIEVTLGLPARSVLGVERRANGDYAIVLNAKRVAHAIRVHQATYAQLRDVVGKRVLRIPRRAIHRQRRRGGRKWRGRNRRLWEWALAHTGYACPAAHPARMDRDDRMLDDLREAVVRASHRGTAIQAQRELERRFGEERAA
jgi:hypothetical protein